MKKGLKAVSICSVIAICLSVALLPVSAKAQWVAVASIAQAVTQEGVPTISVYNVPASSPEVVCAWMVMGAKAGDQITGSFVAVDVGNVAPPNFVINTAVTDIPSSDSDTAWGHFTLSRPTNGWPLGRYRVEIKKSGVLVAVAPFEISDRP